jgi:hypothetical protein
LFLHTFTVLGLAQKPLKNVQMNINLQRYSLIDVELLQQIGRATYEPYYQHIWKSGGLEWYMQHCFNTSTLQTELADPNIAYYLPTDEAGNIIGLLKLGLLKPVPEIGPDNALYLEKIYLMAAELQREAVWLYVMQSGPVKSYERAGFQVVGSTDFGFEHLLESERLGWRMVKKVNNL